MAKKKQKKDNQLLALFGAVLGLVVLFVVAMLITSLTTNTLQCQQATVPVTLSAQSNTRYNIVGSLCARGGFADKTVELLVSGVSYDHNYWDFPLQPEKYSYERAALNAGYAVFNFDRLGVGQSDHPPAADVTVPAEAYVTHQLVVALREGRIAATPFTKVIGVGHSMGAGIVAVEGGTYNDMDGLVLADSLHQANTAKQAQLATTRYPAQQDPKFANRNLPDGYLTTRPNTRGDGFYDTQYADSAVIAKDEDLKQTVTTGELSTLAIGRDTKYSEAIHVPVLLVVGDNDSINCNSAIASLSCKDSQTVLNREKANFAPQACLEAFVLPQSGHDTNLHYTASRWFNMANTWADSRVGPNNSTKPTNPCMTP